MTILYSQLLADIDDELTQNKESADSADAEKYRTLPRSMLARYTNHALRFLSDKNPLKYEDEMTLVLFNSSALEYYPVISGENFYIDMATAVSGNVLTLPDRIKKIQAIMSPFGENTRLGEWFQPYDSSASHSTIYCPSPNKIYNSEGWLTGDVIRVRASLYPIKLKTAIASTTGTAVKGTTTTVTLAANNGIERGDRIIITASTPVAYQGTHEVIYASGVTLVINLDSSGFTGNMASGTINLDVNNQVVDIDETHYRLLYQMVKRNAFTRKRIIFSREEDFELGLYGGTTNPSSLINLWMSDDGKFNRTTLIKFTGNNFGGRR